MGLQQKSASISATTCGRDSFGEQGPGGKCTSEQAAPRLPRIVRPSLPAAAEAEQGSYDASAGPSGQRPLPLFPLRIRHGGPRVEARVHRSRCEEFHRIVRRRGAVLRRKGSLEQEILLARHLELGR